MKYQAIKLYQGARNCAQQEVLVLFVMTSLILFTWVNGHVFIQPSVTCPCKSNPIIAELNIACLEALPVVLFDNRLAVHQSVLV